MTTQNQPSPYTAVPVPALITRLRTLYPDACCELNYETPIQLLVATILSAQSTDVRVNQVTPTLFERFPDAAALAAAARTELEKIIKPVGFYRQKARYIQETAVMILSNHQGDIPADMTALTQFTGVARKTANVVLGEIFGIAEGITVDTHVKRLAKRFGLTSETKPVKVERDLMAVIPQESWIEISHLLIFHGRRVCFARNPNCPGCALNDICPAPENETQD